MGSEWISVDDKLPIDNTMCYVMATPTKSSRDGVAYRHVRMSDGDHFWDNLVDEILQDREVTHWMPIPEPPNGS